MSADEARKKELQDLTAHLKKVVADLYDLELTAADYPADAETLIHDKIRALVTDYEGLERLSGSCNLSVPQDVLEYIEAGRNPTVYTRQFSEAVTKESQNMYGKMTAHRDFAQELGDMIKADYPELSSDVDRARKERVQMT